MDWMWVIKEREESRMIPHACGRTDLPFVEIQKIMGVAIRVVENKILVPKGVKFRLARRYLIYP